MYRDQLDLSAGNGKRKWVIEYRRVKMTELEEALGDWGGGGEADPQWPMGSIIQHEVLALDYDEALHLADEHSYPDWVVHSIDGELLE